MDVARGRWRSHACPVSSGPESITTRAVGRTTPTSPAVLAPCEDYFVSQGTVLYYRGLCALRRGDPATAKTAFDAAAAAAGSTLESGDGPSAAAAASRMIKSLE